MVYHAEMIQTNKDNWWYWSFNDIPYADRINADDTWKAHFTGKTKTVLSFREELIRAAQSTRDTFPNEKFTLLLSGGSESEMILRAFVLAGVDIDVVIVAYENNVNSEEVYYATTLCDLLGKSYKILDFNLKRFFENDIDAIMDITQIERARMLPQVAFADKVDGIPIGGSGDPHWIREHKDYSKPAKWCLQEFEHELGWDRYFIKKDRQAMLHWLRWTPELVISYTKMDWFKKLTSNQMTGKLGNWSSKLIGYTEQWPEITQREKKHGFEDCDDLIEEVQQYIYKRNKMSYFTTYEASLETIEAMHVQ